ncbi:LuxR C-terminal-related transcriptional regulator [Roseiconus lacunae]|uniref:LuxR C-terminal-related transcriptional regulator n=1 Tax=Roseiconus lacunae TaxID=2605694 RepID=A0ABT7PMP6_9BACT|nr:LuxR C-terminal-related transcriptional regulator [Roseiconus lacunae]MCD0463360.1 LuxR C-terminal-related transcriptional regulator [Roseiconus lacunae]MDM4017762.1 LuxR C-terminal-related transcriptional regulator [Roseiconus lacunae]WRQ48484.1 LuxR C-terminal-related transcriptional regulator [Stieleria sp. HD01]
MQSVSPLDLPQVTDFIEPYFFFSNRGLTEVTYVSPSVERVLGYNPATLPGASYSDFLVGDDPLNDDVEECQRADLSGGRTIHALRSVFDRHGSRRILAVNTVGVCERPGGPIVRRHNIARDVTESVESHRQLMMRLHTLDRAARQLSPQEREVAELIMEGKMNRDIARELNVSDRTVERRRAAIMKHLDAATVSEMVARLVERELLRKWTFSASDAQWQTARNSHLAVTAVAG